MIKLYRRSGHWHLKKMTYFYAKHIDNFDPCRDHYIKLLINVDHLKLRTNSEMNPFSFRKGYLVYLNDVSHFK